MSKGFVASLTAARGRRPARASTYKAPSDAVLLRELEVLGLAARPFGWPAYAKRLGEHLGLSVRVERLEEVEHPVLSSLLNLHGIDGGLFPEPERNRAWVVVPTSISEKTWVRGVWHELSHIAAGHPVPAARVLHGRAGQHASDDVGPWYPQRRLARAMPPKDRVLREAEADLRADFLSKVSVLGRGLYWDDAYFMGVERR